MSDDGKKMSDHRDEKSLDEETKNESDVERLAIDMAVVIYISRTRT